MEAVASQSTQATDYLSGSHQHEQGSTNVPSSIDLNKAPYCIGEETLDVWACGMCASNIFRRVFSRHSCQRRAPRGRGRWTRFVKFSRTPLLVFLSHGSRLTCRHTRPSQTAWIRSMHPHTYQSFPPLDEPIQYLEDIVPTIFGTLHTQVQCVVGQPPLYIHPLTVSFPMRRRWWYSSCHRSKIIIVQVQSYT